MPKLKFINPPQSMFPETCVSCGQEILRARDAIQVVEKKPDGLEAIFHKKCLGPILKEREEQ